MAKYTTLKKVLTLARDSTVVFADAEYLHGALSTKQRPSEEVWKFAVQIGIQRAWVLKLFYCLAHPIIIHKLY